MPVRRELVRFLGFPTSAIPYLLFTAIGYYSSFYITKLTSRPDT